MITYWCHKNGQTNKMRMLLWVIVTTSRVGSGMDLQYNLEWVDTETFYPRIKFSPLDPALIVDDGREGLQKAQRDVFFFRFIMTYFSGYKSIMWSFEKKSKMEKLLNIPSIQKR